MRFLFIRSIMKFKKVTFVHSINAADGLLPVHKAQKLLLLLGFEILVTLNFLLKHQS
jgi:hypothetical protein